MSRKTIRTLRQQLTERASRFNFFQAVRILNRIARESETTAGGRARAPVGEDAVPHREIVRFRAAATMQFPTTSIVSCSGLDGATDDAAVPEMTVSFMGLTGPNGVLPHHYTQLLIDRLRAKDVALRDFLDLFNHRLISHFYRAWEKYRLPVAYETAALSRGELEDDFSRCLFCLVGLGNPALRRRLEVPDQAFVSYGGHYAHLPRNAVSLEAFLTDYFQVRVRVLQFVGQWLYLSADDQTRMPVGGLDDGRFNQLGISAIVGARVWGIESKFRIVLGPLDYETFRRFSPEGDALVAICQMVRTYVGLDLDFEVQPLLRARDVPPCRLGKTHAASRLGWNSWILSKPRIDDADEAIFVHEGQPLA